MIGSTTASDFKWDDEVCEFFSTIKYLGGETRKFATGSGFFGTGKGGIKEFKSFSDLNLCGPSTNALQHCQAGYTTESGVIKPHLQSLHSLSQHPKTNVHKIVETDLVTVIPLALASDGTALKPGLEYDQRQKRVVGLIHEVDTSYVKEHPVPDPQEIKHNLITGADITCAISIDNGATMPVAVHYRPKAVNGEAIFSSMEDEIKTIQTCKMCLGHQHSNKHIVTSKTSACVSKCEECLSIKSMCLGRSKQGQVSHLTSLRAYDACLENGVTCNKLAVLAVSTDCEACNKKALLQISDISESENLAPEFVELELVVPLPDVVHLGKSIRCSWSN